MASSVPVLNGVSLRVTPLPRFLVKKPFCTPTSAVACVMFARNPSLRVTCPPELPEPPAPPELPEADEFPADEPHPAASKVAAATPAAITARFIVHLFRST